jgi:hypothetical protein
MQNNCWLFRPKASNSSATEQAAEMVNENNRYPLVNPEVDSEIRSNKVEVKSTSVGLDDERFSRFSSWNGLIRALGTLQRYVRL